MLATHLGAGVEVAEAAEDGGKLGEDAVLERRLGLVHFRRAWCDGEVPRQTHPGRTKPLLVRLA